MPYTSKRGTIMKQQASKLVGFSGINPNVWVDIKQLPATQGLKKALSLFVFSVGGSELGLYVMKQGQSFKIAIDELNTGEIGDWSDDIAINSLSSVLVGVVTEVFFN